MHEDPVGRAVGIVGLAGIALIHVLDSVSKYGETRYIFFLYILLIVTVLGAAALLLRGDSRTAWAVAALTTGATLTGYILSRTIGLPQASQDIGNWSDPLGLTSVFVESCTLVLASYKVLTLLPGAIPSVAEELTRRISATRHQRRQST